MRVTDQSLEIRNLARIPQWREWQARVVFDLFEASGLNLRQFCMESGIGYRRMLYWRGKLNQIPKDLGFIEISPNRDISGFRDSRMEIVLRNQRVIRVDSEFDESALDRLIGIVEK